MVFRDLMRFEDDTKLMSACERALQVNESVVAVDQQTYHEVLLASFDAMHERLLGFFGTSVVVFIL
ncbi:hypothetical protein COOONC_28326 [Cooperia oncophora]